MQRRAIFALMIILLSPAKDLDTAIGPPVKGATEPRFQEESRQLISKLRSFTAARIGRLMDISPKLAELNRQRYADWHMPFTAKNAKPAMLTFNGEVYRGLKASTLSKDDVRFAQRHLRILSGLHGLLRPLDLIQPYRLEMGCGLKVGRARDLYAFWGDRIARAILEDLKAAGSDVVVDLASNEYAKSARRPALAARIITPVFKDKGPGGYKVVMVFAKHQRGSMARWIIAHRLLDPQGLKRYDVDGYRFNAELSDGDEWVFTRDKR